MSKQITFVLNEKGGVGKSTLVYFYALKYHQDPTVMFYDTDTTIAATMKQCAFLEKEGRLKKFDFLSQAGYNKSKFNELFKDIASSDKQSFFVDCGSQESKQFLLVLQDFIEVYKEFQTSGDYGIRFLVPIGNNGIVFSGTIDFVKSLMLSTEYSFPVYLMINIGLFNSASSDGLDAQYAVIEELKNDFSKILKVQEYGKLYPVESTDKHILDGAGEGLTLDQYDIFCRGKIRNRIFPELP